MLCYKIKNILKKMSTNLLAMRFKIKNTNSQFFFQNFLNTTAISRHKLIKIFKKNHNEYCLYFYNFSFNMFHSSNTTNTKIPQI